MDATNTVCNTTYWNIKYIDTAFHFQRAAIEKQVLIQNLTISGSCIPYDPQITWCLIKHSLVDKTQSSIKSLLNLEMDKLKVIVVQECFQNIDVMNNSVSYWRAFISTFVVAKQVSFLNCVIICTCYLLIWM